MALEYAGTNWTDESEGDYVCVGFNGETNDDGAQKYIKVEVHFERDYGATSLAQKRAAMRNFAKCALDTYLAEFDTSANEEIHSADVRIESMRDRGLIEIRWRKRLSDTSLGEGVEVSAGITSSFWRPFPDDISKNEKAVITKALTRQIVAECSHALAVS